MDILRGSVVTLAYRISGSLAWLVVAIITARALNPGELGVYVSTVIIIQAIGTVAASFASATGYFVSRGGRPAPEVASNAVVLSTLTGGALMVGALGISALYEGEWRSVIFLGGLSLLPVITRHALGGVCLGVNALWRYNFSVHGPAYINVIVLLAWVVGFEDHTEDGALAAWAISQYASLLILLAMTGGWWGWLLSHRPDWRLIRAIVGFGAIIGVTGLVSYFNYRIDQLLVAGLDSSEGAGVYSRAVNLAEALWLVSTSIGIASYARVGSTDRHEAAVLTTLFVRHTLVIVLAGAGATFVLAPYLIRLFFGEAYAGATGSLRVLCVGTALWAPQSILANYFTVQMGRPWISMVVATFACLINVAVCFALVPHVGYIGGAWATTTSYAVAGAVAVVIFLRTSDARWRDLWRPRADDLQAYARAWRRLRGGRVAAAPPSGNGP